MTVPPISAAATPEVRPTGQFPQSHEAGEAFERVLLGEMTKTLVESSGVAPEGPYAALLPESLTDALMQGGGIGLARALNTDPPTPLG